MSVHGLAQAHGNRDYKAEAGMLDTLHGASTRHALAELARDGLVREVTHAPETSPHWQLTEAGHARAQGNLGMPDEAGQRLDADARPPQDAAETKFMIAAFFESIPAMIMLTGVLVGAASSLIGVFLVLRGSAMLTRCNQPCHRLRHRRGLARHKPAHRPGPADRGGSSPDC